MENLKLEWNQIKGKGVLTVSDGVKKHEHLMPMQLIRRILSNKIVREYRAKSLQYLLDGGNKTNIPTKLDE